MADAVRRSGRARKQVERYSPPPEPERQQVRSSRAQQKRSKMANKDGKRKCDVLEPEQFLGAGPSDPPLPGSVASPLSLDDDTGTEAKIEPVTKKARKSTQRTKKVGVEPSLSTARPTDLGSDSHPPSPSAPSVADEEQLETAETTKKTAKRSTKSTKRSKKEGFVDEHGVRRLQTDMKRPPGERKPPQVWDPLPPGQKSKNTHGLQLVAELADAFEERWHSRMAKIPRLKPGEQETRLKP